EWNSIPSVVQLHGPICMFSETIGWPAPDSPLYALGFAMEQFSVRAADAVFSSSACSTGYAARHYGLDPARVPTLHAGVDTKLFRPVEGEASDRPTIAFAGRLTGDKGVFALIAAVKELVPEFPDLRLRLLGRADDPADIERAVADLPPDCV